MATPDDTRMIRVSVTNHATIHNLANDLNGTANDAVSWLLDPKLLRIHVSAEQRARWQASARRARKPLGVWVVDRLTELEERHPE